MDPADIYFAQIADIPLLSHDQELAISRKIKRIHHHYRRVMLGSDLMIQCVIGTLQDTSNSVGRFDSNIETSLNDVQRNSEIKKRLKSEIDALKKLLSQNQNDYAALFQKDSLSDEGQNDKMKEIHHRRHEAFQKIESLCVRTNRLVELFQQVIQISEKINNLLKATTHTLPPSSQPLIDGDSSSSDSAMQSQEDLVQNLHTLLMRAGESASSLDKRVRIVSKLKKRYEDAKQVMTDSNLRLVVFIARHYIDRGVDLLDLIQEGNRGLMRAVDKFEYARGNRFSTYAYRWILQGILRAVSNRSGTIAVPENHRRIVAACSEHLLGELGRRPTADEIANRSGLNLDVVQGVMHCAHQLPLDVQGLDDEGCALDMHGVDPSVAADHRILMGQIRDAMHTLDERDFEILQLRFGFTNDGECYSLNAIAQKYGVSKQRISQLESRALKKIREACSAR